MFNLIVSSGCVCLPVGSGTLLIDADAIPKILAASVRTNNSGYAHVTPRAIHRLIMDALQGDEVDHINGDKLDNRRANLRFLDHRKNCQNRTRLNKNNTSGASGVYWRKRVHSWQAVIQFGGRQKSLGYFKDKEMAIAKRKAAEALYYRP